MSQVDVKWAREPAFLGMPKFLDKFIYCGNLIRFLFVNGGSFDGEYLYHSPSQQSMSRSS